ncbi:hypothetical protein CYMTET_36596 [Cymbomonas tetramitiformis]|uniref:Uncharacterized protein n=1 Tax=Cymbomonas tetramitiformis TaxID=36881 RepID=A0AAE0F7A0_9CHLO|nr:hypothetical protein CYMTET_36596 [Cymbomonas tetramitiformis]
MRPLWVAGCALPAPGGLDAFSLPQDMTGLNLDSDCLNISFQKELANLSEICNDRSAHAIRTPAIAPNAAGTEFDRARDILVSYQGVTQAEQHTALHRAAQLGHVLVANALLEVGADLEATNRVGCTPLHLAADMVTEMW